MGTAAAAPPSADTVALPPHKKAVPARPLAPAELASATGDAEAANASESGGSEGNREEHTHSVGDATLDTTEDENKGGKRVYWPAKAQWWGGSADVGGKRPAPSGGGDGAADEAGVVGQMGVTQHQPAPKRQRRGEEELFSSAVIASSRARPFPQQEQQFHLLQQQQQRFQREQQQQQERFQLQQQQSRQTFPTYQLQQLQYYPLPQQQQLSVHGAQRTPHIMYHRALHQQQKQPLEPQQLGQRAQQIEKQQQLQQRQLRQQVQQQVDRQHQVQQQVQQQVDQKQQQQQQLLQYAQQHGWQCPPLPLPPHPKSSSWARQCAPRREGAYPDSLGAVPGGYTDLSLAGGTSKRARVGGTGGVGALSPAPPIALAPSVAALAAQMKTPGGTPLWDQHLAGSF